MKTVFRVPSAILLLFLLWLVPSAVHAQPPSPGSETSESASDVLSPAERLSAEQAIGRGLDWLARQQKSDGSFTNLDVTEPAITSLCVMAFLAGGHQPGAGPFGGMLDQAINFVMSCQKDDGLLAQISPRDNGWEEHSPLHPNTTGTYTHAIAGVMLCEAYGMMGKKQNARMQQVIEKALNFTINHQKMPKRQEDVGGWRYLRPTPDYFGSDLSVTAWHLMFLRSARNAGFAIPVESIEESVQYIKRCFDFQEGTFRYAIGHSNPLTRTMAGAGILSLALSGLHQTPLAKSAADWLLARPYDQYNQGISMNDRYHYGGYHCTLAMFQMGGHYWHQFYPPLARALLANQTREGRWPPEANPPKEQIFGSAYTTALAVMILAVPNQLVPIYQR